MHIRLIYVKIIKHVDNAAIKFMFKTDIYMFILILVMVHFYLVLYSCFCYTDIWVIGDSLVYWTGTTAQNRGQPNIGQSSTIGWFGTRGMGWATFHSKVQYLCMSHVPPKIIFIHLGGNDLESLMLHKIRNILRAGLQYIRSVFPQVKLVWIDIIQRRIWRSGLTKSMEKKRKRVNKFGQIV